MDNSACRERQIIRAEDEVEAVALARDPLVSYWLL